MAIGGNTVAAKDSANFTLRGKATEDEAIIAFAAGASLTSYQWLMGYENEVFSLYDGKNTKYAFTVTPDSCDIKLKQDEQKIIFYNDDVYINSKDPHLQIFNEDYAQSGLVHLKSKSNPAAAATFDANIYLGASGGLDNAARINGHRVELSTQADTGYVSAGSKFKACSKYFVSGSRDIDLLNYGTIEDGGGVVTVDLDYAETYSTQTKALIKEEMVEFKTDGEVADIKSGSAPIMYNVPFRAEYSCNLAGTLVAWAADPNEANQATRNGSDMLYNYSGLGYVSNIRQAPAELVLGSNVPGPWNKGSYSHWYDGGLH